VKTIYQDSDRACCLCTVPTHLARSLERDFGGLVSDFDRYLAIQQRSDAPELVLEIDFDFLPGLPEHDLPPEWTLSWDTGMGDNRYAVGAAEILTRHMAERLSATRLA